MSKKRKEKKEKKGFIKEFKEFISKGNILDLAIGVIIGGAFNAIVTTLNQKILMPIVNWVLSYVFGRKNAELVTVLPNSIKFTEEHALAGATPIVVNGVDYYSVNYISWSSLIETIINFLFIALTLFIIVKIAKYLSNKRKALEEKRKAEEAAANPVEETPAEPAAPVVTELDILKEIRDLLQKQEEQQNKK